MAHGVRRRPYSSGQERPMAGNTQKDLVQNALPRQILLWDKPHDCWKALCPSNSQMERTARIATRKHPCFIIKGTDGQPGMLLSDGLVPLFWDHQGCLRLGELVSPEI